MAYAVVYWLHDDSNPYPAWGRGATLQINWILPMLIRNVLACWIICGFWDWFLYLSPWQKKLHKFKMNPIYPSMRQLRHDALIQQLLRFVEQVLKFCYVMDGPMD